MENSDLMIIAGGLRSDEAVRVFVKACCGGTTLFITDRWIAPRIEALLQLLNDPITDEEAEALQDAATKLAKLDHVIQWLGWRELSWNQYKAAERSLAREMKAVESQVRVLELQRRTEYYKSLPRPACPKCGDTGDVVPIQYGYVHLRDQVELASRGVVAFGGCLVGPESERWICKICGGQFFLEDK